MSTASRFPVVILLALLLHACGSDPDQVNPPVGEWRVIQVFVDTDTVPDGFVAVASWEEEEVTTIEHVACGTLAVAGADTASAHLKCDGDAIQVAPMEATVRLVFKVKGAQTSNVFLSDQTPKGDLRVSLRSLAAPEDTVDYATWFDAEKGPERFQQLAYPSDTELGPAHALKFYINNWDSEPKVYFQNTRKFALHYNFANQVLGKNITRTEFDKQTYYGLERKGVAGTIVWYPKVKSTSAYLGTQMTSPLCMTFFPSDGLTPQMALQAHRLVEQSIGFANLAGGDLRVVYLPAGATQESQLATATKQFALFDSAWTQREELYGDVSLQVLNPGLAYGTLRLMTPEEMDVTPVSFQDILLLTHLPNDLPIVGGTITEELQTPLAHVNVMARTRGTPNIALLEASKDPRIAPLLGKLVRFEVKDGGFTIEETTLAEAEAYWDSLKKDPSSPPCDLERKDLPLFSEIGFAESISVGVKAANVAELTRVVSVNAPSGFAVPFYYYQQFMTQSTKTTAACEEAATDCVTEGRPQDLCDRALVLCVGEEADDGESFEELAFRMLDDATFRSDTALRDAALNSLRYLIRNTPVDPQFASALDMRVLQVFGGTKARLRSSTNAEDLPNFSGAGLYTSVGAYASGTDAASLEIRKVWASIWNFKAVEERTFWAIDHKAVKMAVLVSTAYPDEIANGVLITQNIADPTVYGMYVNVQLGEIAVTNPEAETMPEIFTIVPAPGSGVQVSRQRFSSLSPNQPVMTDKEIRDLYYAGFKIRYHFAKLYNADESTFAMDIEFKLYGEDRTLIVKQARPYSVGGYVP